MAQINKPTDYFNTVLYTGDNSSNRGITGVGFQPDLVWNKNRSSSANHNLWNGVTGITERLTSSGTQASEDYSSEFLSFDSDGVTITQNAGSLDINNSSYNYVNWNWKAGGTASSNTDGSITSNVSANTTSGFSIVSYTGTGSLATVGHGLGSTPKMMIFKNRSAVKGWSVYHNSLGATKFIFLNETNLAETTSTMFNNTEPTSTLFTVNTDLATNVSGNNYIAYCFAEKKGFSKFGSYTGNGNADGTFVYTGFKPAFVIMKRTSAGGTNWQLIDNKRSDAGGNNIIDKVISPNASDAEYDEGSANWFADFVSNGFKIRNSFSASNSSGATYIYMCFAESPLVGTNNTPATAR